MDKVYIINSLIKKRSYKKYLEIGVRNPDENFNKIEIDYKDGVDPSGNCNYPITSDEFFRRLNSSVKYDIILIDGMHEESYVDRDIQNSLKHLNDGGILILHDCNPPDEWHQRPVEEFDGVTCWNGTVWRSIAKLRLREKGLKIHVVDIDWGVGLIEKGEQNLFENFTYSLLRDSRKELLNLIEIDEFNKLYL